MNSVCAYIENNLEICKIAPNNVFKFLKLFLKRKFKYIFTDCNLLKYGTVKIIGHKIINQILII